MSYSILLVDDDPLYIGALTALLTSKGYLVESANTAEGALQKVQDTSRVFALVILDYRLHDRQGSDVAKEILGLNKDLYILIHSGDSSREALQNSWRAGAVGFIEKSESADAFLETVQNWCQKFEATFLSVPPLEDIPKISSSLSALGMVGRSTALSDIAEKIAKYKKRNETVLITGETGTGKERVARAFIQDEKLPFLVVNCASYNGNSEIMESELFGYVKGAFTGANKDQRGVFEEAQGGIVFLDEIHTLSEKAQQKLLRVIQEKLIRPVGSAREYPLQFRLLAAAKPDIDDKVEGGQFLPDFFERINVLRIDIPPLRNRPEDIEPLVAHFCKKYAEDTGEHKTFLVRTLKYLVGYSWPRNVRELENTVRRLCIDSNDKTISPEHLDAKFFATPKPMAIEATPLRDKFDNILRTQVEQVLSSGVSKREAARRLGMPESSLRRAMKNWEKASRLH